MFIVSLMSINAHSLRWPVGHLMATLQKSFSFLVTHIGLNVARIDLDFLFIGAVNSNKTCLFEKY